MRYIFLLLLFTSCFEKQSDNTIYEQEALIDSSSVKTVVEESKPITTYSYIVFITSEPTHSDVKDTEEFQQYTTEIDSTIGVITEDEKYKILDEAENNLRDVELNDTEYVYDTSIKIISRDMFIFDNYKEASISRQKTLNKN